jgi:hypothetical protein
MQEVVLQALLVQKAVRDFCVNELCKVLRRVSQADAQQHLQRSSLLLLF